MPLFTIRFNATSMFPPYAGPEAVELRVGAANYTDCNGAFIEKTCTLVPAILQYEVIVQHNQNASSNVLNFARAPSEAKLVALANNTNVNASDSPVPMTISALASFLNGQMYANATMHRAADPRDAAVNMPDATTFNNVVQRYTLVGTKCDRAFSDPTTDVLSSFNSLMFRTGIVAAKFSNTSSLMDEGLSVNQTVTAQETRTLEVFRSDLRCIPSHSSSMTIS